MFVRRENIPRTKGGDQKGIQVVSRRRRKGVVAASRSARALPEVNAKVQQPATFGVNGWMRAEYSLGIHRTYRDLDYIFKSDRYKYLLELPVLLRLNTKVHPVSFYIKLRL